MMNQEQVLAAVERHRQRRIGAAQRQRILWVEDEEEHVREAKDLLQSREIDVEGVTTTQEASARIAHESYDLIIADVDLSRSDTKRGDQWALTVGSAGPPVVIITGREDLIEDRRALDQRVLVIKKGKEQVEFLQRLGRPGPIYKEGDVAPIGQERNTHTTPGNADSYVEDTLQRWMQYLSVVVSRRATVLGKILGSEPNWPELLNKVVSSVYDAIIVSCKQSLARSGSCELPGLLRGTVVLREKRFVFEWTVQEYDLPLHAAKDQSNRALDDSGITKEAAEDSGVIAEWQQTRDCLERVQLLIARVGLGALHQETRDCERRLAVAIEAAVVQVITRGLVAGHRVVISDLGAFRLVGREIAFESSLELRSYLSVLEKYGRWR